VRNSTVAWKRFRLLDKELAKLSDKVKRYYTDGRSHQEACDAMIKELYVRAVTNQSFVCFSLVNLYLMTPTFLFPATIEHPSQEVSLKEAPSKEEDDTSKPGTVPQNWEHAHNHVITTFRLYYKGPEVNFFHLNVGICRRH
jgi:hypothetical protein